MTSLTTTVVPVLSQFSPKILTVPGIINILKCVGHPGTGNSVKSVAGELLLPQRRRRYLSTWIHKAVRSAFIQRGKVSMAQEQKRLYYQLLDFETDKILIELYQWPPLSPPITEIGQIVCYGEQEPFDHYEVVMIEPYLHAHKVTNETVQYRRVWLRPTEPPTDGQ